MLKTIIWPLVNSASVTIIGSILTFFVTKFWTEKRLLAEEKIRADQEKTKMNERISDLERSQALLTQAVQPISAAFQAILIKELTHFHTPVMDALLIRLGPPNILTKDEEAELTVALEQRSKDLDGAISDSERDAATMLPMVMKRVKIETDLALKEKLINVVLVPDHDHIVPL